MCIEGFGWGGRVAATLACAVLALQPTTPLFAQQVQTEVAEAAEGAPGAGGEKVAPLAVADALAEEPAFTMEELELLVGPIALYPDPLLIQVLLASTYPLDVVRAHRFLEKNEDVTPEELVKRAEAQGWDPSVISLVAFATVLERMAAELDWTESLGAAMNLQLEDLLDAVQNLREQAQASGALQSNEYQTVSFEEEDTIVIAPAEPETIYVPQYEPQQVFATMPASTTSVTTPAETVVVDRTGYSGESLVATGLIAFTVGILIGNYFGRSDRYDYYWGSSYRPVAWHHHHIYPPYYRPGGYRPPHYRPRPPGYRPGDAWRPRPEHHRAARRRVETRREVTRDINRNVNVNIGDRVGARPADRASRLELQLRERGRDRGGVTRPAAPQRPTLADKKRPAGGDKGRPSIRPGSRDTAFVERARTSEVRKNRDRGAQSVHRAARPAAGPAQRPARAQTKDRPLRPQATQRSQQAQRPKAAAPAFARRGGGNAGTLSDRGRASSGGRLKGR